MNQPNIFRTSRQNNIKSFDHFIKKLVNDRKMCVGVWGSVGEGVGECVGMWER